MQLLNQLPCPVLVTDAHGRVLAQNAELLAIVGGAAQDWLHKSMDELFPPASRIFLQTHVWPMLWRQESAREIYLFLFDRGRQRVPVMASARHGSFEGSDCYYWVLFVASERSRFEAELIQARGDAQRLSGELKQANLELGAANAQLEKRTTDVEVANRELAELSQTDPLTGLGNRRALAGSVLQWQSQALTSAPASLLLVDVDHFKAVNDRHGHDEGDRVLAALARQLQASVRASDLAVRYGGEEFALWLPTADRVGAGYTAQRVHDHVRQVLVAGAPITVSIGLATAMNALGPELLATLLSQSDKAVYQAKAAGRNCSVHFD